MGRKKVRGYCHKIYHKHNNSTKGQITSYSHQQNIRLLTHTLQLPLQPYLRRVSSYKTRVGARCFTLGGWYSWKGVNKKKSRSYRGKILLMVCLFLLNKKGLIQPRSKVSSVVNKSVNTVSNIFRYSPISLDILHTHFQNCHDIFCTTLKSLRHDTVKIVWLKALRLRYKGIKFLFPLLGKGQG